MNIPNIIQRLDAEWDSTEGNKFFSLLRKGIFDEDGFKRVQNILTAIELPSDETLDKRFVELTWFIPTFMRWQQDGWRLDGKDTKQLDEAIAFVEQRLTTILGLP